MRALIVSPGGPLLSQDVPEPEPRPDEALVEVRHASANFGELRHAAGLPPGTVMGYDAAGVVLRPASDGSGPGAGERVVAFGAGAWAERAAFPTGSLAVVPAGAGLAEAAALPLAGLTALRTIRAAGPVLGRRLLVTGASGGVGRYAVQLARRAGAYVIASVGAPGRGEGLRELGADEVVVGLDGLAPVDVVLELTGGPALVRCWELLRPGGSLQSVGWASGEPAVLPPGWNFSLGPARTLSSFGDVSEPGPDLAYLAGLLASGGLSAEVAWRGSWERIGEASRALLGRRLAGKIVMDL
ncbi:zinc-binding dehydrogenase [Microbispora sp. ATCC PTA-5024]|uniref:zinc-binding dehydrogenase n=1 Tax=Microbispora sp. ATCC PTA-5024 TaxID=316330 RepID=UPI0003DBE487|nr:zinc-binding dehydrogenase [Microbispora sp. ATCC PTA-5024]ETK36527.1 alcohol dehydrogenase [Microbispora sp. ATCC PTA-5024]